MLQTFKLEADMEVVRGNVIGLNSLWNNRTEDRPFHNLGASAYFDIRQNDIEVKESYLDHLSKLWVGLKLTTGGPFVY
jgi:hypothetical protein